VNPRTRYARRDGAAIAYQTHGEGPVDLVFLAGVISHIEHLWEDPALARLFDRQAEFSRLILMDRRGTGLSDPLSGPLVPEEEVTTSRPCWTPWAADICGGTERAAEPGALCGRDRACLASRRRQRSLRSAHRRVRAHG
jgi:pimeloyl-ACP methyl ester carboxylesterase